MEDRKGCRNCEGIRKQKEEKLGSNHNPKPS